MFGGWRSKKASPGRAASEDPARRMEKAVSESIDYAKRLNTDESQSAEPKEEAPPVNQFRRYGADWMDEVIRDQTKKGNLDQLPGEGKPLQLGDDHSMQTLVNNALKTANYLPRWVELQREIKADLEAIMRKKERDGGAPGGINDATNEVNRKIRKYNDACPSAFLQRSPITSDNIFVQYEKWK